MIHWAVKGEQGFFKQKLKGFPHRGNSMVAPSALCLPRTANSYAQQHHVTKVFVNEFKLRTNITFAKDHSGSYILDPISLEAR